MLIALVRSLVDPSLWVQSSLAMNCLSPVCLLPQQKNCAVWDQYWGIKRTVLSGLRMIV